MSSEYFDENYQKPTRRSELPPSNGLAVASTVMGALNLVLVFVLGWWLAPLAGILVVTSIMGLLMGSSANKKNARAKHTSNLPIAGIVLNAIALVISILAFLVFGLICGAACVVCNIVT